MEASSKIGDPVAAGTGASQIRSFKMSDFPGVLERYEKTGRIPNLKIKLELILLEINLPGRDPYRLTLADGRMPRLEPGVNVIDPPAQLRPGDLVGFRRIRPKLHVVSNTIQTNTLQPTNYPTTPSKTNDLELDDSLIEVIPAAVEHHPSELARLEAEPGGPAPTTDPIDPRFTFGQGHRRGGFWTRYFSSVMTGCVS